MVDIIALAWLVPASVACLYYLLHVVASLRCFRGNVATNRSTEACEPQTRIAVLIPAHNEELSLPITLQSLLRANYPQQLLSIVVVADNCSDRTAERARALGACVLERNSATERGKGYALRFGLDHILPTAPNLTAPDLVVILDADCQVDTEMFRVLANRFAHGDAAVQVAVVTRNADDGPTGFVGAIGNAFDNILATGKDRLGLSVPLRGSGMAFRRDLLERFPWNEYGLVEDADYAHRLARAGVRIRFESATTVRSESPASQTDLFGQRRRWRAAIFSGPGFLARWLDSKPLVLLQLALTGLVVAWLDRALYYWWYGALATLTILLYAWVVRAVGLTPRRIRFLFAVPGIVARLALVTLGGVFRREQAWQRTRRVAEIQAIPTTDSRAQQSSGKSPIFSGP